MPEEAKFVPCLFCEVRLTALLRTSRVRGKLVAKSVTHAPIKPDGVMPASAANMGSAEVSSRESRSWAHDAKHICSPITPSPPKTPIKSSRHLRQGLHGEFRHRLRRRIRDSVGGQRGLLRARTHT